MSSTSQRGSVPPIGEFGLLRVPLGQHQARAEPHGALEVGGRLVRPHPPLQSVDLWLVQLNEDLVLTHPAIALNAANEVIAVVVNLDEPAITVRAAFIHGPISLRMRHHAARGARVPLTQNL
jgi:hypothetical protein